MNMVMDLLRSWNVEVEVNDLKHDGKNTCTKDMYKS